MDRIGDQAGELEAVAREVRASLAFEHMIAAALVGGGISAGVSLLLRGGQLVAESALGLTEVLRAGLEALLFGVFVFLLAFAAAVAVFTPMYVLLEKNRVRKIWPFHLTALAVQYLTLSMLGEAPGFDSPARLLFLLPGVLIVWLFGRRIVPLWRAADLSAAAAPPGLRLIQ